MNIPNREEIEKLLASRISGTLRRELKELMGLLGNPPDLLNVPAGYWSNGFVAMQKELEPALLDIYIKQSERFINDTMIGIDWNMLNTTAEDWAKKYTYGLVYDIEKNTRSFLQNTIPRFYSDKWTLGELQNRLGRWYGPVRSEMIAITETTRAAVEGERAVVDQLGQETGIEMRPFWECAMDELVCPVCGPKAGREIIGKKFPPAHPRCRCWVSYKLPKQFTLNPEMNQAQKEFQERMAAQRIAARQTAQLANASRNRILNGIGRYLDTSTLSTANRTHINTAITEINKIHDVPDGLTTLPVEMGRTKDTQGWIEFQAGNQAPVKIVISEYATGKEMTFVHEFGHYLDHQYLGGGSWGTVDGAEVLKDWRAAVYKSDAFRGLSQMRNGKGFVLSSGKSVRWGDQYLDYLLDDKELFARSYAQYIAEKSGNNLMLENLRRLQGESYAYFQWQTDDFKDIFKAIDEMFQEIGILK